MQPESSKPQHMHSVLDQVLPALERAAQRAREAALVHNTDIVVWRDNRVCRISPRELREQGAGHALNKLEK